MRGLKKFVLFLGRFCLSALFIISAIQKIFNWRATEESVFNQMCEWSLAPSVGTGVQSLFEGMMGWIPLLMGLHIVLELVGGISMILGIRVRLAAFLLILALLPATLLYHNFWMLEGDNAALQAIMFLKNLSILGGLLVIWALGNPAKAEAS